MDVIDDASFRANPDWAYRILQDLPDHIVDVRWLSNSPHWCQHAGEALLLVLEGCLDVLSAATPHTRLHPGHMALIAPGESHLARPHGCARILTITRQPDVDAIASRWIDLQPLRPCRLPACL